MLNTGSVFLTVPELVYMMSLLCNYFSDHSYTTETKVTLIGSEKYLVADALFEDTLERPELLRIPWTGILGLYLSFPYQQSSLCVD